MNKQQAALEILLAVANAIKELGTVPSGHLYAQLMSSGMSLENYQAILKVLEGAGAIEIKNHLITYVGPR